MIRKVIVYILIVITLISCSLAYPFILRREQLRYRVSELRSNIDNLDQLSQEKKDLIEELNRIKTNKKDIIVKYEKVKQWNEEIIKYLD